MPETAYISTHTDHVQGHALMKLARMAMLKDNWDGYGAEPLPRDIIYKALRLIPDLHFQPEIFPTAEGSIQFEFDKDNGDYLEFQFTGKGSCEVFRITGGNEEYFCSQDNTSSLNALIDAFYGYSL